MAVWMELRCDWRNFQAPASGGARCHSHDNHGPMDMAANNAASVQSLRREIFDDAKRAGWTKHGSDWACPSCSPRIASGEFPTDLDEL